MPKTSKYDFPQWLGWAFIIVAAIGVAFMCWCSNNAWDEVETMPFATVKVNKVKPTVSPSISTSPISTADWKTYTNTKYGFSFKYPANLSQTDLPEKIKEPLSIGLYYGELKDNKDLQVSVELTSSVAAAKLIAGYKLDGTRLDAITYNNIKWTIFISGQSIGYIANKQNTSDDTSVILSTKTQNKELINQILSTFQFTK